MGYTKLFNSILASTVWMEPDHTRLVWITMLALADRYGFVPASVPGLASLARISKEKCEEALVTLSSPDPDSRSTAFDGRRIEKVEGGWNLLNYETYRRKLSVEERREYNAMKQREHRERLKQSAMSLTSEQSVHIAEAEADTEAKESKPSPTKPVGSMGSPEFRQFWDAYPKRVDGLEALKAWVKGLCDGSIGEILAGLEKWKQCEQWTDPDRIPYPSTWLNKRRWKEVPEKGLSKNEQKRERTKQAIERVRAGLD